MPTYDHLCACGHEWEDFYSIKQDPPTECPSCHAVGQVKRLVSGGSGRGIVELSGQELKNQIKSQVQDIKKDMYTSEKTYANLLGEDRYQGLQSRIDQAKSDRPKFRSKK